MQENLSARATASLISLVPDQLLIAHSLQDIELDIVNTEDDDKLEPIDYYALVKNVAEIAPSNACDGKTPDSRIVIQVIPS
jgi:hypothetical protein